MNIKNQPEVGPETWEHAAENLSIAQLDGQFRDWLQDSEMPGTAKIKGADWPLLERVKFLKLLCGDEG